MDMAKEGGEDRRGQLSPQEEEDDAGASEDRDQVHPVCPEESWYRHMCFSELREGLLRKAIKLCARTGAQLAIVVFSPAGKPYSFAHPSVDAVIKRYRDPSTAAAAASEATTTPTILRGFDRECTRLCKAIAAEGRRRDELDAAARAAGVWTSDDVRGWGMPRLVAMLAALERVQAEVAERTHEMVAEEALVQRFSRSLVIHGDGSLTADGGATSSHHGGHDGHAESQMMLLGGNLVSNAAHAPLPAFPPTTMMLPPDFPPPPRQLCCLSTMALNSEHNPIAGCAGYCYDQIHGDDSDHGAPDETEGYYGTMTTCNFLGSNGQSIIL